MGKNHNKKQIVVRFAPSPTGSLHVGNARTAIFNWLFTRNAGGKMIFRLEDTDIERSTEKSKASIIKDITWLGLDWDDGPYLQSERLNIYKEYLQKLESSGHVYKCFCTTEDLEKQREYAQKNKQPLIYDGTCSKLTQEEVDKKISDGKKFSYRFRVPNSEIKFKDLVKKDVKFDMNLVGDFVIMRPNGYPTYNFSVVIDDALMGVNHIVRGEDILPSTPRQILLYKALGFELPTFAHLSLISGPGGKPLHKRDGATSLSMFREGGYLPEAMFNFLALLSWSPKNNKEILPKDKLIKQFRLSDVSKSPAQFDYKKLKWMNSQYLNRMDNSRLLTLIEERVTDAFPQFAELSQDDKLYVMEAVKSRIDLLTEAESIVEFFFKKFDLDDEAKEIEQTEDYKVVLKTLISELNNLEEVTISNYKALLKTIQEKSERKGKGLFMSLRVAVTGSIHGPDLKFIFAVLGKDGVLARLS